MLEKNNIPERVRRTSGKTKEAKFKGNSKKFMLSKEQYVRGQVDTYARSLIKKVADGLLVAKDAELASMVVNKFGGATSVKSIQWYRCQMRKEGLLPEHPKRKERRYAPDLTYEVIAEDGEVEVLTAKKLIAFGREECIRDGASKNVAFETVYSVGSAAAFLVSIGYEVIDQNNYEEIFNG